MPQFTPALVMQTVPLSAYAFLAESFLSLLGDLEREEVEGYAAHEAERACREAIMAGQRATIGHHYASALDQYVAARGYLTELRGAGYCFLPSDEER